MGDINEFIGKLGDDIGDTFAPRIEEEVVQIGNEIAGHATPKVHAFADQLFKEMADLAAPKMTDFANELVKDIFTQQSAPIRDFVIGLMQELVGRYEPSLAGNLHTNIVDQGVELVSDDMRLEMKERTTGNLIASLDLPVNLHIDFKDLFVKLDSATIRLENVQL